MQRICSAELPAYVGQRVRLDGWLHRLRRLSSVTFVVLRDGRGLAQIVVADPADIERLSAIAPESSLRVEGEVVASTQAPRGAELRATAITVLEPALEPPPFEL